jgi:hypothetical protein
MAARTNYQASSVPVTATEGQRACARQERCSAKTRDDDGTWHPARAYAPFCPADTTRITQDAEALPKAWERLAARIGDPARTGRAVRVPPGSRVLVNPEIDALLRLIADLAGGWAARTRAIPGLSLSRPGHPHGTAERVGEDCDVLATQTVPLLALPSSSMARTWTWPAGSPMPDWLEAEIGDLHILHIGDGWVRALTELGGEAAGLDVLDLHRDASRLLKETPAPPEYLDGIPCRSCEAMSALAIIEQPPPEPEKPPPPWCRCTDCRDEMTRKEYEAWAAQYAAWTKGSGILTCRRCDLGLCERCCWRGCSCAAAGHRPRL